MLVRWSKTLIFQCFQKLRYLTSAFDRPQFQQMLADIEKGLIDTVLTKDLSRLGRDQIYTAYYYQLYFPQHGVRYIAVAEDLDTASAGATSALFPFLTAANDFYTADVSRKVRSALTARKREGKFIGSQPPLGYGKDPANHGHLIVDEEAAPTIRYIFRRYQELGSIIGVAKELTERQIPTPSQYRGTGPGQKRFAGVWNETMVRRILTNPTYAGHLTQNRRVKINYKIKKRENLPQREWITVPNTHQAIIDQEQFDLVQRQLEVHSYRSVRKGEGHLLTGLAYCADCGSPMTYVKESETRTYMVCQGYRRGGRLRLCTAHCIREDQVIRSIGDELRALAKQLDVEQLESACESGDRRAGLQRQMERYQRKLDQQKSVMGHLYQDRAAELLTEEEFRELFQEAREKRAALEEQLRVLTEADRQDDKQEQVREEIRRLLAFEELDRSVLTALVERVEIHQDKTIEVTFRFRQPT